MVLGKLPVPGRPTNLSRTRAYNACSRCGCGLFGHFFSCSLGDGPNRLKILSQSPKQLTNNNNFSFFQSFIYHI